MWLWLSFSDECEIKNVYIYIIRRVSLLSFMSSHQLNSMAINFVQFVSCAVCLYVSTIPVVWYCWKWYMPYLNTFLSFVACQPYQMAYIRRLSSADIGVNWRDSNDCHMPDRSGMWHKSPVDHTPPATGLCSHGWLLATSNHQIAVMWHICLTCATERLPFVMLQTTMYI